MEEEEKKSWYDPDLRKEHDETVTRFENILKSKNSGIETRRSNDYADIFDHWDSLIISYADATIPFLGRHEIKSRKKLERSSSTKQDEWFWIEFKNVEGYDGWLYGKAHWIDFEVKEGFIMVRRQELKKFAEPFKDKEPVENPSEAMYRPYTRKNRKDLTTMIHRNDLEKLKSFLFVEA